MNGIVTLQPGGGQRQCRSRGKTYVRRLLALHALELTPVWGLCHPTPPFPRSRVGDRALVNSEMRRGKTCWRLATLSVEGMGKNTTSPRCGTLWIQWNRRWLRDKRKRKLPWETRTSSCPHLSWLPFLELVRGPDLASIIHTEKVGHLYLNMDTIPLAHTPPRFQARWACPHIYSGVCPGSTKSPVVYLWFCLLRKAICVLIPGFSTAYPPWGPFCPGPGLDISLSWVSKLFPNRTWHLPKESPSPHLIPCAITSRCNRKHL